MREEKAKIHEYSLNFAQNLCSTYRKSIQSAQESSNNETKSTAGDKHDTSRAMIQLEVENLSKQLKNAEKQVELLQKIDTKKEFISVQTGALVKTNQAIYYIATGIGRVLLNEQEYFVISPASPIGQALLRKQKGDRIDFQNDLIEIKEVI